MGLKPTVNTYFKLLFKCSFKGVITQLSDHFVIHLYKMIFEQDPPSMSKEEMEASIGIANLYTSLSSTFIRIFSAEKPPHLLPKFSLDVLVMQEVAYKILGG